MAGTPLAGTGGRVRVNAIILNADKWSAEPVVNDLPTTNFESTGTDGKTYEEGISDGIRACAMVIELFWDSNLRPHNNPPNIRAGSLLTNVELYVSKGLTPFTALAVRVLGTPLVCEVNGVVRMTVNGRTQGEFSYPS